MAKLIPNAVPPERQPVTIELTPAEADWLYGITQTPPYSWAPGGEPAADKVRRQAIHDVLVQTGCYI